MYIHMPTCIFPCLYVQIDVFTCLDLCSLHSLYYLPCAFALCAMFVCLDLGYVCHAMCYCSLFVSFIAFSCILAYWFRPNLDPTVFVIVHVPRPISKWFGSFLFACLCLLASMFYACVSLSSSRLCYVWCPLQAWPYVVTSNAHEALFGFNPLGGISGYWVATCVPFPFPLRIMLCLPCLFV